MAKVRNNTKHPIRCGPSVVNPGESLEVTHNVAGFLIQQGCELDKGAPAPAPAPKPEPAAVVLDPVTPSIPRVTKKKATKKAPKPKKYSRKYN